MKKKTFWISFFILLALVTLAALKLREHWQRDLVFTDKPAYQFEPQSHTVIPDAKRPVIAATASDELYLLAVENHNGNSGLYLRMSHDQGDNWMQPQLLSSPDASVNASAENAPQLAAHAMYAYALWQERSDKSGAQLRLARATGMGEKALTVVSVTDTPPESKSFAGFASLALAPNGDVFAVWLDGRDNTIAATSTFNVYLARSTDKGMSFHKNVKVATLACPCCRPSLAFGPSGEIYVAYRHVDGENVRDVAVAVSHDHGDHFNNPVIAAHDGWKLVGCPESGPVTTVQNGKLIVAWYSAADKASIRLAESRDGGQTFSPEVVVSRDILDANHPYITSSENGAAALVFSGRAPASNGSWGAIHSFLVSISPDGHISAPQLIPSDAEGDHYPTVTIAQGNKLFVTGSGNHNDIAACYLARARQMD
ncbi:MAG TPA: sialidase family protein [Terriglobales bacterium]|jgi:hypothetical protein